MERLYLAYTRVSTAKQGDRGVSLQEQQDAIQRYSQRYGLAIKEWFEERERAAKRGRPVFTRMLKLLRQGTARGIIIHKIDRSARNLKDCAPERTRIVASDKITRLSLLATARYLVLDEPQRERFAGILPYLVRGIPRRDFDEGGAAVRLSTLGALFGASPPTADRIAVERERPIH